MSTAYDKILKNLNATPKTQAEIAHIVGSTFKTVTTMVQRLTKNELAYVHGYVVYPNGKFKKTYCFGKKPETHKVKRPYSKATQDFTLDANSVKMILPASASDVCNYFEWDQDYVKKVMDFLVETYTVEKVKSKKTSLKDSEIYYLAGTKPVTTESMWPGWNDVKNPNIINGVEIRTTWRHQLAMY